MATRQGQTIGRLAVAPSVAILASWSIVPLALAIYYAFLHYKLDDPNNTSYAGWSNFYYFVTDPFFAKDIFNTVALVFLVIGISVVGGTLMAMLLDRPFWGRGIVRVMVISPFFIMPTVSALVWKNLMMHPVYGLFAHLWQMVGLEPLDWFAKIRCCRCRSSWPGNGCRSPRSSCSPRCNRSTRSKRTPRQWTAPARLPTFATSFSRTSCAR